MAKLVECRDSLGITMPQTRTSKRSNGKWPLPCDSLCDSLARRHKHLTVINLENMKANLFQRKRKKEIDLGLCHNFTRVIKLSPYNFFTLLVKDTGGLEDGVHQIRAFLLMTCLVTILEGLRSPGQSQHTRRMIYL